MKVAAHRIVNDIRTTKSLDCGFDVICVAINQVVSTRGTGHFKLIRAPCDSDHFGPKCLADFNRSKAYAARRAEQPASRAHAARLPARPTDTPRTAPLGRQAT